MPGFPVTWVEILAGAARHTQRRIMCMMVRTPHLTAMVASSLAAALPTVMPKPIRDTIVEKSKATCAGAPPINVPYAVTTVRTSTANNSVQKPAIAERSGNKTGGYRLYNIEAETATVYFVTSSALAMPSCTSMHLLDLVCLHIWVLTTAPHAVQVLGPAYS